MATASTLSLPLARGGDRSLLRKAFGLRARLITVLLLALAPSALLLVWQGSQKLQEVRLDAQQRVLQAAQETAEQQQEFLDTAETVMTVLSQAQSVRLLEPERCTGILSRVRHKHSWMASLYVLDVGGDVRCAHKEVRADLNLWHDEAVQRAVDSGALAVGEYRIGQLSGVPIIPIALPVYDSNGDLQFLIVSGIELSAMNARLAKADLPVGSIAIVVEDDGTVLSSSSTATTEVGKDLADRPLLNAIALRPQGVAEMTGLDDLPRFYGFAPLDPGRAIVVVGIPRAVVMAPVRQWVFYWMTALLCSVVLGVPLAWLSAEWLVLRTARRIASAARSLASGEEVVRAGVSGAPCELGELARQFDIMAERLSHREHELRRARDEALKASVAKSNFVAHLSHDLRTPLNAIIGFSQVIRDQRFGPQAWPRYVDYAGDIGRSGEHLLSLINRLLDLAKMEADQLELQPEPLKLANFFTETAKLVQNDAQASQLKLEVRVERPDLELQADPIVLKQIVLNLLSNAVRYSPPGGVVRLSASTQPSGVCIKVADSGIGMAPTEIEQAFRPFVRNDDPLVRSRHGTGLGLPIVKRLVELHHGTIDIDSQPQQGTTVTVLLPTKQSPVPAETDCREPG